MLFRSGIIIGSGVKNIRCVGNWGIHASIASLYIYEAAVGAGEQVLCSLTQNDVERAEWCGGGAT